MIVDWSANSSPKTGRDSIWIGEAVCTGLRVRVAEPQNPATRTEAVELIVQRLVRHVDARRRVLIAFDVVYGYPQGFADALGLPGAEPPWLRTWRHLSARIADDERNRNNRWAVAAELNRQLGPARGPFWNCPRGLATSALGVEKGRFPHLLRDGRCLAEYRLADMTLRRSGRLVQSVWKLFTTGSVGSQTLLGIPRLHALRTHGSLAPWSRVWPFETGFTPRVAPESGRPWILHAESWPRIVAADPDPARVLDARQVTTLARHFPELDAAGKLGALFERPAELDDGEVETCLQEEGWVLGI